MKNLKWICLIGLIAVVPMWIGCATTYPRGVIYTELKLPVDAESGKAVGLKTGTAECKSVLGLVATGDCSINAAMRNGNLTEVSYVDWEVENVLGVIGNYKLVVHGK